MPVHPLSLLTLALLAAEPPATAPGEAWTDLVGDDLTAHWQTDGNWSLGEDGVITLEPRKGEKGWDRFDAYLWSAVGYDDFEVRFDYLLEKGGNSGFYFNVGDKTSPVQRGIEVQLYDSHRKGKDKRLTDHDAGGIIPGVPPTTNAANPPGEWNTMLVRVEGDALSVTLNGELVNEVDLTQGRLKGRPASGHIGFQDHALPLKLRNIKTRPLAKAE